MKQYHTNDMTVILKPETKAQKDILVFLSSLTVEVIKLSSSIIY